MYRISRAKHPRRPCSLAVSLVPQGCLRSMKLKRFVSTRIRHVTAKGRVAHNGAETAHSAARPRCVAVRTQWTDGIPAAHSAGGSTKRGRTKSRIKKKKRKQEKEKTGHDRFALLARSLARFFLPSFQPFLRLSFMRTDVARRSLFKDDERAVRKSEEKKRKRSKRQHRDDVEERERETVLALYKTAVFPVR